MYYRITEHGIARLNAKRRTISNFIPTAMQVKQQQYVCMYCVRLSLCSLNICATINSGIDACNSIVASHNATMAAAHPQATMVLNGTQQRMQETHKRDSSREITE